MTTIVGAVDASTVQIEGVVSITSTRFDASATDGSVPVEVAEVDMILAVAATDGTNTSWTFLAPTPGAAADGLIPAGWSAAGDPLSGTGAQFATLLAAGGFADGDTVTILMPGGDAVGVWQFTPATIEDPWTPLLGTLVYANPSLLNRLGAPWQGLRTEAGWVPGADATGLWAETFANDAALASTDAVFSLCGTSGETIHNDRAWTTPAPDVTFTTGFWHRSVIKVKPMYRDGAYDGELVFSELGTQTHDDEFGSWDNFEPAIVRIWSEATQTWKNYPYLEVTVEGGTEETIRIFPNRSDNTIDPWPYTVDLFTGWAIPEDTWVELGMDLDFTGADGNWRCRMLLRSLVTTPDVVLDDAGWRVVYACHGDFPGSIDSGVTEPWALGLDKGEVLVPWVKIADGPSGTVFANPTATAALAAFSGGPQPFTDDVGNLWTPSANASAYDPTATSGGVALGETSATAYRGDRGKTAYDHSQVVTGNPHGTTAADVGAQPLDSDLTAIAALSTTSYGRAFLALADAAAGRTALGLGTAALSATGDFATAGHNHSGTYQPLDSDLTAIAALTTTSFGRALLELADAAAARTALGTAYGITTGTVAEGVAIASATWRSGSYYGAAIPISNAGNTMASGVVRAMPFFNPVAGRTIDQLALDVFSASGTPAAIVYICTDSSGYPGAVVASGTVVPAATSRLTASVSYTLPRGLLWLVAHSTAATWAGLSLFGPSPYMPAPAAYSANPISCWAATGAGTSTLTSFPAGATPSASGIQVLLRAA